MMRFSERLRPALPVFALSLVLSAGMASPSGGLAEATAPVAGVGVPSEEPPAPVAQGSGAWSSGPIYPEMGTVRAIDLPRAPAWQPGDPIKEIPRRHLRTDYVPTPAPRGYGMDPLAELQARTPVSEDRAFSASYLNKPGIGYQPLNPPDPVGAVGRDYYVQMVNGSGGALFAIYDKGTGLPVLGATLLSSLIAPAGRPCDTGLGDPIVLYDQLAERWIMTEFSSTGNALCAYFSWAGDPTGTWYRYEMVSPNFPDYPKYAVWPDAYYVSTNESGGPAVYAWYRERMLNAGSVLAQRFTVTPLSGFNFQALTPADLDGNRTPLPGEPGIFMRHNDDESHSGVTPNPWDNLDMWEFHVDWANHPAGHSLTQLPSVQTSEFDSDLCGLTSFSCFPQRFGGVGLDPLREVIMWRLAYRNFGTHESLVGNFVTDVNGSDLGGVRWFELRRQGPSVGSWTLYQEGTYSPTTTRDRWMGSIAMDGGGNIALGFNMVSSVDLYASFGRTGRLSSDPLGVMTKGETHIIVGAGVNPSFRYGDYNAMTVDPVDDCTFWLTGEYNASAQWATRISVFRFDECPLELETIVMDEEEHAPGSGKH